VESSIYVSDDDSDCSPHDSDGDVRPQHVQFLEPDDAEFEQDELDKGRNDVLYMISHVSKSTLLSSLLESELFLATARSQNEKSNSLNSLPNLI
jgi:hypothetical protein